jgi:acetoin utilization deacetylase AcuC-like enzyme
VSDPNSPIAVGGTCTTRRAFLRTIAVGLAAPTLLGRTAAAMTVARPSNRVAGLPTAVVFDDASRLHLPTTKRYECPARYEAVCGSLKHSGYFSALRVLAARSATDEEILSCHGSKYLAKVRREIESGVKELSTGCTWISHDSLKAAREAVGAACVGIDAVLDGRAKNAFCVARPPGHHATANRGMGFCIFNNVAIAARYAQRKHGVGKVMIVDWDVHHGNGTQEIFYEDPSVFYFSTHQSPWYPWTGKREETGRGKGRGTTLNCPLKRGAGRKEFFAAFHGDLMPAFHRFKPELVILSTGFDARHGDPLGRLELVDQDYTDLTAYLMELARPHAGGRIVSILEGGYNLVGLAAAATAHCARLQEG